MYKVSMCHPLLPQPFSYRPYGSLAPFVQQPNMQKPFSIIWMTQRWASSWTGDSEKCPRSVPRINQDLNLSPLEQQSTMLQLNHHSALLNSIQRNSVSSHVLFNCFHSSIKMINFQTFLAHLFYHGAKTYIAYYSKSVLDINTKL